MLWPFSNKDYRRGVKDAAAAMGQGDVPALLVEACGAFPRLAVRKKGDRGDEDARPLVLRCVAPQMRQTGQGLAGAEPVVAGRAGVRPDG
jgi:hypothetical protein